MFGVDYPVGPLPRGRYVDLPGRGRTFIRTAGSKHAPTLILLHGWGLTGGLNFHRIAAHLSADFHVVMMDVRGHGRGIHGGAPFGIDEAADDVAALISELGLKSAAVGGYSLGGDVAAHTWRRHPQAVSSLVIVSVGMREHSTALERGLLRIARRLFALLPAELFTPWWLPNFFGRNRWLRPVDEIGRDDVRRLAEAAQAINKEPPKTWVAAINVPCAVVISARDVFVPKREQEALARLIPTAIPIEMPTGHLGWFTRPKVWSGTVAVACRSAMQSSSPHSRAIT